MRLSAGGKEIELYYDAPLDGSAPILLLYGGGEKGELIWAEVRRRTSAPFALAVIPVTDWEGELSPWPAKAVFRGGGDFGDGAGETVRALEKDILPAVRAALGSPNAPCYVAGYSLAGLFALYALYETGCLEGALSASAPEPNCFQKRAKAPFPSRRLPGRRALFW